MSKETSTTVCTYPICAALDKADDIIGRGRKWGATNALQGKFLRVFESTRNEARMLKDIESIASRSAGEINKFLANRGFQIALDPFEKPTDFGTASVLDVLVKWLEKGTATRLIGLRTSKEYPAVLLKGGVSFKRWPGHQNPIAVVETKTGELVYLTVHDRLDGFELLDRVNELRAVRATLNVHEFKGLYFPQVDLDQMVDIGWLKQLWTHGADGHDYEVAQALQQTKFRINEEGARAQSAVAIGVLRCTSLVPQLPPLVINRPFLVWIERPGLKEPLFAGWICEDDWKRPKDINER